ncbi:hypothetical protein SAMN04488500_103165 [Sporomusa malonica]|uniref:Uncharacterized protein n=2 Tax=Sporomusa malonica TaxID=112901 RepID=A0A1W1ZC53_9FIRM|nr:hypothetical protein SAMN04488500_103165 [Sporomusa malonica]
MLSVPSGVPFNPNINVPDFDEFHQRIISGEVDLADAEAKRQYAKVHLKQVMHNMRTRKVIPAKLDTLNWEANENLCIVYIGF